MTMWTKDQEAEALKKRFESLKRDKGISRAAFARNAGIKGGDSMINQHITGHRPLSKDAAIAYAKGFGCSLYEISPRLASEAEEIAAFIEGEPTRIAAPLPLLPSSNTNQKPDSGDLPVEFQTLLNTITDAARTGGMTPEQAAAFDNLIKTSTGTK